MKLLTMKLALALLFAFGGILTAPAAPGPPPPADPAQVLAALSEKTVAFGRPIDDRAAWAPRARSERGRAVIRRAEELLRTPLPEGTDEVYLALHKAYTVATRSQWNKQTQARRDRVAWLTQAECLENKGRFIPALEQTIRSLCAEKTWVFPNYDKNMASYRQTLIHIDLFSSAVAWNLATADNVLGDRLSPAVRRLIRQEAQRRIFEPFRRMLAGKQAPYWLKSRNNWNSVCLAGVTGTALALLESREERAFYVKAAMDASWTFLNSYTEDGYCSEGVGYWNYGFGHYVLLAGIIAKATDGRIDLLTRKQARASAAYGACIEIVDGVVPSFADCDPGTEPESQLMNYVNHRFGFGLPPREAKRGKGKGGLLFAQLFYEFDAPAAPAITGAGQPLHLGVRTWFDRAGILIGRPAPGSACRLAVALKGGSNGEQHNHNDVGSYMVLVGGRAVLVDPGQEARTGRTFSSRRYESKLLNSFGHPVPRVAGALQQTGDQARAVTLQADLSDARDLYAMDIKSAYAVPELKSLTRTFEYSRTGAGSLSVKDEAAFASPQAFETALVTFGQWKQTGPHTLRVENEGEAVQVEVETGGVPLTFKGEAIYEEGHSKTGPPTRIAIRLDRPVEQARVEIKITPAAN